MTWMGLSDQNLSQISLPLLIFLFPLFIFSVKWMASVFISPVALALVFQVLRIHKFNLCGLPTGIQNVFMINCPRQSYGFSWKMRPWKSKKKLEYNIRILERYVTHALCFLTFNISTNKCTQNITVIY